MKCYHCGTEATGYEHIPPKSFFPEGSREELITVPSCDLHNQKKSKDDEYVRMVFLSSILTDGNESLVKLKEKNARALERAGERILQADLSKQQIEQFILIANQFKTDPIGGAKAFDYLQKNNILNVGLLGLANKETQPEIVKDNEGNDVATASFLSDYDRIVNFFENLSRGLYFHKLGKRWVGNVTVLPHFFLKSDAQEEDKYKSEYFIKHLNKNEAEGKNKNFFYFDGFNDINPKTHEIDRIFFNFCIFDTFKITAVFPLN